jgi:hypothetical protein
LWFADDGATVWSGSAGEKSSATGKQESQNARSTPEHADRLIDTINWAATDQRMN